MVHILQSFSGKVLVLVTIAVAVIIAFGQGSEEFTFETLGDKEKSVLEEFKTHVIPEIPSSSYIQNYVNDDLYFFNWLKATSFDLKAGEKMFLKHLKWRKAENIDTIDQEDWTEMKKDMPMFVDTVAKDGTPTNEVWAENWDIRKVVSEGKAKDMVRWRTNIMEVMTRRLFKARAEGENFSGINIIAVAGNAEFLKLACLQCILANSEFFTLQSQHYPNLIKNIFSVDVNPAWEALLEIMKPFISTQTRNVWQLFSVKEDWMALFDKLYDKDQRGVRFGGTIVRNL